MWQIITNESKNPLRMEHILVNKNIISRQKTKDGLYCKYKTAVCN